MACMYSRRHEGAHRTLSCDPRGQWGWGGGNFQFVPYVLLHCLTILKPACIRLTVKKRISNKWLAPIESKLSRWHLLARLSHTGIGTEPLPDSTPCHQHPPSTHWGWARTSAADCRRQCSCACRCTTQISFTRDLWCQHNTGRTCLCLWLGVSSGHIMCYINRCGVSRAKVWKTGSHFQVVIVFFFYSCYFL